MDKVWRVVEGYEGEYWVSACGRIKNKKKILRTQSDKDGYRIYTFSKGKKKWTAKIHRLVLSTFTLVHYGYPLHVNHEDGDKTNNHFLNLNWVTAKENSAHAVMTGLIKRGEKSTSSKLTEIAVKDIRYRYFWHLANQRELAKEYGVVRQTISKIISRKRWGHI